MQRGNGYERRRQGHQRRTKGMSRQAEIALVCLGDSGAVGRIILLHMDEL